MGYISHLFVKSSRFLSMEAKSELTVIKGIGIDNDKNASSISPRQILITRKEDLDELAIPYGGLRENIILEGIADDIFLPGSLIIINEKIKIRLTFYCEPCKRISDVVPSISAVMFRRGILGVILNDGIVQLNDIVTCIPNQFEPFSEVPYERFLQFIRLVPRGKVVTYKMVSYGMGVAESYTRAFPHTSEKHQEITRICPCIE